MLWGLCCLLQWCTDYVLLRGMAVVFLWWAGLWLALSCLFTCLYADTYSACCSICSSLVFGVIAHCRIDRTVVALSLPTHKDGSKVVHLMSELRCWYGKLSPNQMDADTLYIS